MVYTRRFWLRLSGFRILGFRVLGFVCCWKRSTFAGIWAYKHQRMLMPDPPHANLVLAAECSKPPLFPLFPTVGLVHVVERGPLTHAAMQSLCSGHHSLMGQCEPPCLSDWQGSQRFSNSNSAIHWSAIWSVASSQDTEANAMWLWIVSPTPRQVASATTFMIRLLQENLEAAAKPCQPIQERDSVLVPGTFFSMLPANVFLIWRDLDIPLTACSPHRGVLDQY